MNGPSRPIKFLFDANFGRPLVEALANLVRFAPDAPVLQHLFAFSPPGESDDLWIPRVAPDGWVIISADRAKQAGGPKLPDLCIHFGVTHVLLSQPMHGLKQFEKARVILAMWPDLVKVVDRPDGTRFLLNYSATRQPQLVEVPPKPPKPPKTPGPVAP